VAKVRFLEAYGYIGQGYGAQNGNGIGERTSIGMKGPGALKDCPRVLRGARSLASSCRPVKGSTVKDQLTSLRDES